MPGVLPGLAGLGGDVEDVVGELEGRADDLAVRRQRLLDLAGGAAEAGAVPGGGGDQRAGLAGDHLEVVLERVLAGRGLDGLEDLALDEPGEGLRLDAYGVRRRASAVSSEDFENRKSPVRIATWLSQRALADVGAAAQVGLVHHVVVVERGQVGQLDDAGGA